MRELKKDRKLQSSNKEIGNDIINYLSLKVIAKDSEKIAETNLGYKVGALGNIIVKSIVYYIARSLALFVITNTDGYNKVIMSVLFTIATLLYVSILYDNAQIIFDKNIIVNRMDKLKNRIAMRNIKSEKLFNLWLDIGNLSQSSPKFCTAIMNNKVNYVDDGAVRSTDIYGTYVFMLKDKMVAFVDEQIIAYRFTRTKKMKLLVTFDINESRVDKDITQHDTLGECTMITIENKSGQRLVISNQYLTIY